MSASPAENHRAYGASAVFSPDACHCNCPVHCRPATWWETFCRFLRNCVRAGLIVWDLARPYFLRHALAGVAYGVGFQLARIAAKVLFPHAFPSVVYMPLNAEVRFIDADGTRPVPVNANYYQQLQARAQQAFDMDAAEAAAPFKAIAGASAAPASSPSLDNSYVLAPLPPGTSKTMNDGNGGGVQSMLHRWNPFSTPQGAQRSYRVDVPVVETGARQEQGGDGAP